MPRAQTEQAERNTQNQQTRMDDLPVQGTPQEWLEIVNQFVKLAKDAGLEIEGKTVPTANGDIIVYRVKNANFCPACGHANLGSGFCHNTQCPRSIKKEPIDQQAERNTQKPQPQ